jgi:hypothetical protein
MRKHGENSSLVKVKLLDREQTECLDLCYTLKRNQLHVIESTVFGTLVSVSSDKWAVLVE